MSMIDPVSNPPSDDAPPLMGTGSVCFAPTFKDRLDTSHSVVCSPTLSASAPGAPSVASAQQILVGSALEAFHALRFRFAPPSLVGTPAQGALGPPQAVHALTAASLDTATGRLTASYDVKLASTQATFCQVTHTVTPLRNQPAFVMHSVAVTVDVSMQAGFRVYHDVRADAALTGVRFSGQTFHLPAPTVSPTAPSSHYTLVGSGTHVASGRSVQHASAYGLDPAEATVVGFNVIKRLGQPDVAYTRLDFKLVTTSMSGGSHTYTINVISGSAADGTVEGLQKVAMSFFVRGLDPAAVSAASDAAWADAWASEVTIEAKAGLAPNSMDLQRVQRCQRALRMAMYNIHVGASDRGAACGVVDGYAALRKVGVTDAFIVPILTLLFPGSALAALRSRYDSLPAARAAANMSGLKGARFLDVPCSPIGGGSDAEGVVIEGVSALQLAVTALVGVNAWNYYRVSTDRDWLVSQGYTILKDVADALLTAATVVPNGDPNETPQYVFPSIIGMDGTAPPAADNALTVAAAKVALRGAIEASYLLGYAPRQSWIDLRDSVDVPIFPVPPATAPGIVRRDADSDSSDAATFLEPLMVLTPWLTNGSYVSGAIHSVNLQYWASHTSPNPLPASPNPPNDVALPINVLLLAQAQAMLAQQVSQQNALTEANNFDAAIHAFLDVCSDDVGWGNLAAEGAPAVGEGPNDLSLSCALVLMMMQGLASVTVTGGISDSKYLYQPMGISIATTAVLPPDWARIRINGIGRNRSDYDVVNQLLIPNNYSNNSYVPWSVNILTF